MGIVQRQGFQNTLWSYAGILLGYINKFVLFTHILKLEKMGLAELLLSAAVVFAELARMGSYVMLLRFFPHYSGRKDKAAFNFITTLFLPFAGCILFTLLFFIFKTPILNTFSVKCTLFPEYYLFFLPIGYGLTFLGVFTNYAQSNMKSVVPTAILEVGNRMFHTVAVLLLWLNLIDFQGFLWIFSGGYLIAFGVIVSYLIWLKRYTISVDFSILRTRLMKITLSYGFYNYFSRSAVIIMEQTGVLQVGALMGETNAAIYQIAYFLSQLVYTPARSMYSVVGPIVAKHIHKRNFDELKSIYVKSSLNGFIAGLFVFIIIQTNLKDLLILLHLDIPEAVTVFFFVGLARLIDVANGVNYTIVVYSKHYKASLWGSIALLLLTLGLNNFLIPVWGAVGAGIASGLALLLFNAFNSYIVWQHFKMLPYTFGHIIVTGISAFLLLLLFYLPFPFPPLLAMILRGMLTLILFTGAVYFTGVSGDMNHVISVVMNRLKKIVRLK